MQDFIPRYAPDEVPANSPRDSEFLFNRQTTACASSSISIALGLDGSNGSAHLLTPQQLCSWILKIISVQTI